MGWFAKRFLVCDGPYNRSTDRFTKPIAWCIVMCLRLPLAPLIIIILLPQGNGASRHKGELFAPVRALCDYGPVHHARADIFWLGKNKYVRTNAIPENAVHVGWRSTGDTGDQSEST